MYVVLEDFNNGCATSTSHIFGDTSYQLFDNIELVKSYVRSKYHRNIKPIDDTLKDRPYAIIAQPSYRVFKLDDEVMFKVTPKQIKTEVSETFFELEIE